MKKVRAVENRTVYYGGIRAFKAKEVEINGVKMLKTPTYYRRSFFNETGGITVEFSRLPFPTQIIQPCRKKGK